MDFLRELILRLLRNFLPLNLTLNYSFSCFVLTTFKNKIFLNTI